MVGNIVDKNGREASVFSKLIEHRKLWLSTDVSDESSSILCSQLLYLDSLCKKDITIYINSNGGSVTDLYAITDMIDYIESPVNTLVIGSAYSAAALLFMKGKERIMSKSSYLMIHSIGCTHRGKLKDLETELAFTKELDRKILEDLHRFEIPEEVIKDCYNRDIYIDAQTALKYKIATRIV